MVLKIDFGHNNTIIYIIYLLPDKVKEFCVKTLIFFKIIIKFLVLLHIFNVTVISPYRHSKKSIILYHKNYRIKTWGTMC